jgi:hypothetical protein
VIFSSGFIKPIVAENRFSAAVGLIKPLLKMSDLSCGFLNRTAPKN